MKFRDHWKFWRLFRWWHSILLVPWLLFFVLVAGDGPPDYFSPRKTLIGISVLFIGILPVIAIEDRLHRKFAESSRIQSLILFVISLVSVFLCFAVQIMLGSRYSSVVAPPFSEIRPFLIYPGAKMGHDAYVGKYDYFYVYDADANFAQVMHFYRSQTHRGRLTWSLSDRESPHGVTFDVKLDGEDYCYFMVESCGPKCTSIWLPAE